jgi:hypothetical protein
MSGKGTGYYGCFNAGRKTCRNTLFVPRKKVEERIVTYLMKTIFTIENLEYVYKNVERIAAEGLNEVPEELEKKKAQIEKLRQEIHNYINFIKMGNFSKAVSEALTVAENRKEGLQREIEGLEFQQGNSFKAPPKEWVNHRLGKLRETLNLDASLSALALKELLAPIMMEPVMSAEEDLYGVGIASSPLAALEAHRNGIMKKRPSFLGSFT